MAAGTLGPVVGKSTYRVQLLDTSRKFPFLVKMFDFDRWSRSDVGIITLPADFVKKAEFSRVLPTFRGQDTRGTFEDLIFMLACHQQH